jgi:geranylgeranyl pyrophosphate synthase
MINELIEERLKPITLGSDGAFDAKRDLTLASRHLCISENGKRVRPLLCLYFAWLLEEKMDDLASIGVAAEFIHAASLLHDDIVDEADRRRGKSSTNRLFGNAKAVLAGDFLLTEAFDLLRGFDRDLIDSAILVVRKMTQAAMMELNIRGRIDLSVDCLRQISQGKTGALFGWCGFAAAGLCNNKAVAKDFMEIGERIGFIFQLADDIKDFDGDQNLKDVCRDIRNRELSLPMLFALSEHENFRTDFETAFMGDDISEETALYLKSLVLKSSGLEKVRAMMYREFDWVMSAISPYANSRGRLCLERFIVNLCSIRK